MKTHAAQNGREGFTLVEMLVVVAVFSVMMLIATNIFLVASKASRQAASSQRVQGDVRFALEAIAREVRFGTIDYDCYAPNPGCDPEDIGTPIDLDALKGQTSLLALRDTDGNRIRYKVMDSNGVPKLQVCFIDAGVESLDKCDAPVAPAWQVVTPEDVLIENGMFYLYPFLSPFKLRTSIPPPYDANAQPRVTIVLKTRQQTNEVSPETISAQTSVVSRYYAR